MDAQLKADANEKERVWREYDFPIDVLLDFVIERLGHLAVTDYDLFTLFSNEALAEILKQGVTTIDANRNGHRMMWVGSGGGGYGSLEDGPTLARLFRDWRSVGYIEFHEASGEGTSHARLLERRER
jgi:hypothetical protein